MTPEQKEEFKTYGCLSRCLIAIAVMQEKSISVEEYIERFSALFEENRLGLISYGSITEILKSLGIGRTFKIFRNRLYVRGALLESPRPHIIICTENHPETYAPNVLHSSLLMGIVENNKLALGIFQGDDKIPSLRLPRTEDEIDLLSGFYLIIQ